MCVLRPILVLNPSSCLVHIDQAPSLNSARDGRRKREQLEASTPNVKCKFFCRDNSTKTYKVTKTNTTRMSAVIAL
jgi:hypothetical protein